MSSTEWLKQIDDDGTVFYYNTQTQESVWEKPDGYVEPEPVGDDAKVRDANKLMGEGKAEEALAIYDDILTRRPTAYALHANRGAALDVLGRFEEALAALDKAIELKPSYPEAHHNRGVLLTKMGKYEEAMASHVKAAEGRPNFLEAVRGACDAATRAEKWEEAAAFATQALDINSESVEAHLDRAFVRFKQKQYEGAVEDYKFAYDSGRTDAATKHAYATVLSQLGAQQHGAGDGAGAVASFKKAVAIEPTEGRCFNLGMALTTVGSKEEGLAAYLQATSLNASNFQAWYMVGVLGIQLEQWDTAHQGFTKAAAVKPGEVECLYNAGFALTKLARNDEARSCFQAALKVDSTYAPARNALAALGAPKPKGPKPPAPPPKTVPQEALPSSSPPQAAPADGADTVPDAAAAPTSGGGADTSSAAAAATTDSAATAATAPAATAKTEPATATTESATAAPTTASAPAPASAAPPSPPAVSGSSSATTASAPTSSSASTTAPASASPAPTATATTATAEPVRRQSKKFRKPKPKAAKSSKPAKVYEVFPYAELKGLSSLPPGVDKKNLEEHLSDEEFASVMGCDKEEFRKMLTFKKIRLKIKAGLL